MSDTKTIPGAALAPVVSLNGVDMSFGPVHALRAASLSIAPGECIGLVGHNGAGKSTLANVINGRLQQTGGNVDYRGGDTALGNSQNAHGAGVRSVFQELSLCPNLTVLENLRIPYRNMPRKGWRRLAQDKIIASLIDRLNTERVQTAADHAARMKEQAEKKCERLMAEIAEDKRRRADLQRKLKETSVEMRAEKRAAAQKAARLMKDSQRLKVELERGATAVIEADAKAREVDALNAKLALADKKQAARAAELDEARTQLHAAQKAAVGTDERLKEAARKGPLKGILGVTDEPLVSSDFNHDPHSSIFHLDQTKVLDGNMVRILTWYDNEWGFSNRMSDTAVAMGKLI